jgi:hypothetical protein
MEDYVSSLGPTEKCYCKEGKNSKGKKVYFPVM